MGADADGAVPYTELCVAEFKLHQLHLATGRVYPLAEVAALFGESPLGFAKELRALKLPKQQSSDSGVLRTIASLGIASEAGMGQGHTNVTLLTGELIQQLLTDKRRPELLQPLKLALLKASSQEAADLIAAGQHTYALPLALESVKLGQAIFRHGQTLQLFPLYLLAAQANMGLRRSRECEDFLGLAGWLLLKQPEETTYTLRSQLNRMFGQLHSMQNHHKEALQSFAEDAYYCSLEHGPEDVRTSQCYFNLGKVFLAMGERVSALACNGKVLAIWLCTLSNVVIGEKPSIPQLEVVPSEMPLTPVQLREGVDMLTQIGQQRLQVLGPTHESVGDADFAIGLAYHLAGDKAQARTHLEQAITAYGGVGALNAEDLAHKGLQIVLGKAVKRGSVA